jgi:16S rRNA (guanine527-N7)-methyltransferase
MSQQEEALKFAALIRELVEEEGLLLSSRQIDLMEIHRGLLEIWGKRFNLTSIKDATEIARRHFLEGFLAGALLARFHGAGTLLDLGSGNGFPGVPIRIARPEAAPVILVESSRKRAAFLRAVIREVGWKDSRVEVRRVETSSDLADLPCDIFTTRGVTPFRFIEEGLPFLRTGGLALFFMKAEALAQEVPAMPPSLRVEAEQPIRGRRDGLTLLRKISS